MNTLTRNQIEFIKRNLPVVRVEISEWDYEGGRQVGTYQDDNFEIEAKDFYISLELNVSYGSSPVEATHFSSKENINPYSEVYAQIKQLYVDDTEYNLTDEQHKQLHSVILGNLDY